MRRLLWDWGPGHSRLALEENGEVAELRLWREGMLWGRVLDGRVLALEKRLDAAFIHLDGSPMAGYLQGVKSLGLSEGAAVRVRVKAEAQGGKGPRLALVDADDRDDGFPLLAHLLHTHVGIEAVAVSDAAALGVARAVFPEAGLDTELDLSEVEEEAASATVILPCGGRLRIEHTAALTAVDVDSGPARPADANAEAVKALARHIRLRGLGGQMVVDFVSGPGCVPARLAQDLGRAVAGMTPSVRVVGATRMGLVELVRARLSPSVAEVLCHFSATLALEGLRRVLAEMRARPGAKPRLILPPAAFDTLETFPEARAEVERRLGHRLTVGREPGLDAPRIEADTP